MSKVIGIVGPTAVGKTALSIKLAHEFDGEVISGDSMQVYRHLDIGTAKVTPKEMDGIPHHLINICDIDERFSAARFKQLADQKIVEITNRKHLPIIAGGTGFYLQTLTDNLALGSDKFDQETLEIRNKWKKIANEKGAEYVWQQLNKQDPIASEQIPKANARRVIRALEVIQKTGQLFSNQPQYQATNDFLLIGLTTDRPVLYDRINKRVDLMVHNGLLDEAKWLFDHGGENLPAGKGIGYHELFPYFRGEITLDEAVEKIKQDSRHYAKRQLTWFRNKADTHWFDILSHPDDINQIKQFIKDWLKK
ncbi:tRNA (adenosine(37)-N6)-dimethylallyltransferase MiaA [Limosilactobacillus sp. RRLNB_1_1]|uniref:tRNA dimethylallyltransferase n=1 Tax=Limosilactobacillus albertensis TaxID=2759752 RepID=A0A7W3TSW3_9LACO|nr:tRNA (adenosine(37)-N6)-dimethylallyltransferase MiaA [Limosilactobacillus albertensis]MBB1070284.1 tRNA (adenosine(37)-N6)-dimethylallyltransferase MiaA [Limosilactobacillus albertensis]MCD7119117.1 tRNA (adenosine(37)-N6)-dimethylallyltransferase MiaA [Limosilactobacillus albertensis]MCD7129325.1 tRNA (adenosine(37)-N6)-dimethylallyltransferase MiaA [Limosilactobacillus albertensis]